MDWRAGHQARWRQVPEQPDAQVFGFGAGVMTIPLTITKALAPLAAAARHGLTGGYTAMTVVMGVACGPAALLTAERRSQASTLGFEASAGRASSR